jgi:hypothetical protein
MKKKIIYIYYRKGKIRAGSDFEFVLMAFLLFPIVSIFALFEFIWLNISGKGKWITKRKYYETKLKELKDA